MTLSRFIGAMGAACLIFSSCNLVGGGGGGEGGGAGGGGGASFTFNKGFTYVRKDDRNVYIADDADLQTSATLTSSAGVLNPSLSRNGKQVVFVQKTGTTTAINTVLVGGSTPTALITSDATRTNFHHPVFAPDGLKVAFAYDDGGAASIGLINADGSGFKKLIGGGALAYALPSFTADGKFVIAAAGNAGLQLTQIERIDVGTGATSSITNTLGNEAANIANRLVVSPDGTKAAFDARVGSGVTRIFVIDLSTKMVTKVNEYMGEPGTNDTYPTWYTASSLAFSSDSGGNDNVYRASLTGLGADRKLLVPKAIEPWYGPVQ